MSVTRDAPEPLDWRHFAACRHVDPDLFFAVGDGQSTMTPLQEAEAKAVCACCPVRRECLDDAIARSDKWSVAGGTTPHERQLELRRRARSRRAA